jgi:hypothetical protein
MADMLVFEVHGRLLRSIARCTGVHYQGLRGAASHLRRQRIITPGLAKQLARVDDAFAVLRHISCVSSGVLELELSRAMEASGTVGDRKDTEQQRSSEEQATEDEELNEKFFKKAAELERAELAAEQAAQTAKEKVAELAEYKEGAELVFAELQVKLKDKVMELADFQAGAEEAFDQVVDKLKLAEVTAKKKKEEEEAYLEQVVAEKARVVTAKEKEKEKPYCEQAVAKKPKVDRFDKVDLELEALAKRIYSPHREEESWRRSGWR